MSKIQIELESTQALEFARMLKAMQDENVPPHPIFQGMLMTLQDNIEKGFMKLPREEFDKIFPDKK